MNRINGWEAILFIMLLFFRYLYSDETLLERLIIISSLPYQEKS